MAKISLSKVAPTKSIDKKAITINGEEILVSQYLPVVDKVSYCERVIASSIDSETQYISRARLSVYSALELVRAYTNINITDKMMEEAPKTYDLLVLNGVLDEVIAAIPEKEYAELQKKLYDDSDHLENYLHSFAGIMKSITNDYDTTKMDVDKMLNEFRDPEKYKMLTDVLDKIG